MKILKWFSIIFLNFAFTLGLFELSLHVIPLPDGFTSYLKAIGMIVEQESSFVTDSATGMPVLKPNRNFTWSIMDGSWNVNTIEFPDDYSLGLRDDGLNPHAEIKVFACGDSFTFGFGVNDDFVWHEILESSYESRVDIFNLRFIGNSLSEINQYYPLYKDRFVHDAVFIGIYLGNEFFDNAMYEKQRSDISRLEKTEHNNRDIDNRLKLDSENHGRWVEIIKFFKRSRSVRLFKHLFSGHMYRIGYFETEKERDVYQPKGSSFVFTIDYKQNILVRTCELEYNKDMKKGVDIFKERLAEIVQIIRADNKQVYVFIFPFKEQVYWDQWSTRLSKPEAYDRLKPNYIVRSALEELNIPYYDLTDDMTAIGESEELFWPIDSHWNVRGNQVASELIHRWLDKQSIFEAKAIKIID